jgi:hypothetical protein
MKTNRNSRAVQGFAGAIALIVGIAGHGAERINHEGRILGPMPVVTNAVLFHTPEADAIVSSLEIFPRDSAWNEDISRRPVLSNSDPMIAQITAELLETRRTLRAFYEMNFVLVPDHQAPVPIGFLNYGDESDPSPYPIPPNLPIETWPRGTGTLTLEEWQEDVLDEGGDRHAIIVQPGTGGIWETWLTKRVGTDWQAANGAKWDLGSNALRPLGWTSADAAGLSMFAGLVRYDECERGMVEHAIRIIVRHTRREYLYPATHHASVPSTTYPNVPAMGQRLRLKASFVIPDTWTVHEKAVLKALKKYGALVADNGNFLSISVAPDPRFPGNAFSHFSSVSVSDFEVVQGTGANEGPRSPGAPSANAGPDTSAAPGTVVPLTGWVVGSLPVQTEWTVYSGPPGVMFADSSLTNTTVTFAVPGTYTLMLRAEDGVHAVAYDAVVVAVEDQPTLRIDRQGNEVAVSWQGGLPPYRLEQLESLPPGSWSTLTETNTGPVMVPLDGASRFFRLVSQ